MFIYKFQCILNFLLLLRNNFLRFITNAPPGSLSGKIELFGFFVVLSKSRFSVSRLILLLEILIIYFVIFFTFVGGVHELAQELGIFPDFLIAGPGLQDLIFFA